MDMQVKKELSVRNQKGLTTKNQSLANEVRTIHLPPGLDHSA